VVTDPHTNNASPPVANTKTGPITIHCAAELSAQCNKLTEHSTTDLQPQPAIDDYFVIDATAYKSVSKQVH